MTPRKACDYWNPQDKSSRKYIIRTMDNWVARRLDRAAEMHIGPSKPKAKYYGPPEGFELPADELITLDVISADYHRVEIVIYESFKSYQHAALRYFLHARHADFVTDSRSLITMEADGYRRMLDGTPEEAMWDFYCCLLKKLELKGVA